ncbi:hypothetical protein Tco_0046106 [Tanacetum coccineum]
MSPACKQLRSTTSVPNAFAENHDLAAKISENICPKRSVRRRLTTNQSNLPVQANSLPIAGKQQLDITDTIRNQPTPTEIDIFDRDVLRDKAGQPLLTPPGRLITLMPPPTLAETIIPVSRVFDLLQNMSNDNIQSGSITRNGKPLFAQNVIAQQLSTQLSIGDQLGRSNRHGDFSLALVAFR